MGKVRYRHDRAAQLVQHPNHRGRVRLDGDSVYDETDAIPTRYPHLFERIGELLGEGPEPTGRRWFQNRARTTDDEAPATAAAETGAGEDLAAMTKKELLELAADLNLDVSGRATNEAIIAAITAARTTDDQAPAEEVVA